MTKIILTTIVFAVTLAFSMCKPPTTEEKTVSKTLPKTPCGNFHEGVFVYQEAEFRGTMVVRTETQQTETSGDTIVIESHIIWDSDCSYKLAVVAAYSKTRTLEIPQDTIYVTITEILSDTSYRYKAVVSGNVMEHTMIKL